MPGLIDTFDQDYQNCFKEIFKTIVFSHRHNKIDDFMTESARHMMSIVRDPMYKYSKPAENRFFSVPQLSFLFVIYARNLDA